MIVIKGWGYEAVVENNSLYCGKLLHVKKGKRSSWHYHREKDETFYLLSGRVRLRAAPPERIDRLRELTGLDEAALLADDALVDCNDMEPGCTIRLCPPTRHQFEALKDSVIIEFSTQHRDDDVVRVVPGD